MTLLVEWKHKFFVSVYDNEIFGLAYFFAQFSIVVIVQYFFQCLPAFPGGQFIYQANTKKVEKMHFRNWKSIPRGFFFTAVDESCHKESFCNKLVARWKVCLISDCFRPLLKVEEGKKHAKINKSHFQAFSFTFVDWFLYTLSFHRLVTEQWVERSWTQSIYFSEVYANRRTGYFKHNFFLDFCCCNVHLFRFLIWKLVLFLKRFLKSNIQTLKKCQEYISI